MRKASLLPSLLCCYATAFALLQANANVTITDFELTASTFTLNVSGTIPNEGQPHNANVLFLVNADDSAGLVFTDVKNFVSAQSFSGANSVFDVMTGTPDVGDYVLIMMDMPYSSGDSFDGTFTATWSSNVFHPERITDLSNIQLYWGANDLSILTSGVLLATIPEPSTVALLTAGAAGLLTVILRRRNKP